MHQPRMAPPSEPRPRQCWHPRGPNMRRPSSRPVASAWGSPSRLERSAILTTMRWLKACGQRRNRSLSITYIVPKEEAGLAIFEWISWYKAERLHSSLDYM
jgi:transposase InsO family protein